MNQPRDDQEPETLAADPTLGAPPVDDLPDVQPNAIAEARADRDAAQAPEGDATPPDPVRNTAAPTLTGDAGNSVNSPTGEVYDTRIHEDPPRINAKGGWARRRGGARKGGSDAAPSGPIVGSTAGTPKPRASKAQVDTVAAEAAKRAADEARLQSIQASYKQNGEMAAGAFFGLGQALVGDCMAPEKDESERLSSAMSAWMAESNLTAPPAWMIVIIVAGGILGKRWNHPEFVSKRRKLIEKINTMRGVPTPTKADDAPQALPTAKEGKKGSK